MLETTSRLSLLKCITIAMEVPELDSGELCLKIWCRHYLKFELTFNFSLMDTQDRGKGIFAPCRPCSQGIVLVNLKYP